MWTIAGETEASAACWVKVAPQKCDEDGIAIREVDGPTIDDELGRRITAHA
jgi:hypothetical protein